MRHAACTDTPVVQVPRQIALERMEEAVDKMRMEAAEKQAVWKWTYDEALDVR